MVLCGSEDVRWGDFLGEWNSQPVDTMSSLVPVSDIIDNWGVADGNYGYADIGSLDSSLSRVSRLRDLPLCENAHSDIYHGRGDPAMSVWSSPFLSLCYLDHIYHHPSEAPTIAIYLDRDSIPASGFPRRWRGPDPLEHFKSTKDLFSYVCHSLDIPQLGCLEFHFVAVDVSSADLVLNKIFLLWPDDSILDSIDDLRSRTRAVVQAKCLELARDDRIACFQLVLRVRNDLSKFLQERQAVF
jgi:hypothetical protein